MTTNSQLSTTEPKKKKKERKSKLSQRLEQEQNHRTRDHMEDYHWGGMGVWRMKEKVQGIRSIIGRHKIDGEKSKMV